MIKGPICAAVSFVFGLELAARRFLNRCSRASQAFLRQDEEDL